MNEEKQSMHKIIADLDGDHLSHADLTSKVIDSILANDESQIRQLIFSAVYSVVVTNRRAEARQLEQSVDADIREGCDPTMARKRLVNHCFYVHSAGLVPWLEATAEQHLERAQMQLDSANKLTVDARRHEKAAFDIRNAGVTCLADLEAIAA